ncbi:RsmD family RNA methyltransferase [Candidatus Saccharibacteria bacterium]|nr:RsmD family RNA methyltransferase [Candidatus Saccharibacteria bacterium]
MRIISGTLGGRTFNSVSGHRTHPMSEKIRGALFNSLGDIQGLTVLDAYAGTGAMSFEAISRGALRSVAIDLDTAASRTLKENAFSLGVEDSISTTRAAIKGWSRRHANETFDILLLDPPYDNFDPKELINLTKHAKQGGLIVISLPPKSGFRYGESRQKLLHQKSYGDAELFFYRQL